MPAIVAALPSFLVSLCYARCILHLKMLAVEHPVAVYQQSVPRPHIQTRDRLFRAWLARLRAGWQEVRYVVQLHAVVPGNRSGSRALEAIEPAGEARPTGRAKDVRNLIRTMS
jgi:hypothetical protein